MATTPTQLPIPSEKPQDLKFNAGKIDEFVTSMGWTYTDRFGVKHYTIEGIRYIAEQGFAAQLLSQEQRFNLFIQNSGYKVIGDYEDGPLTITEYNQLVRYDGELWKLTAATDIPFTTTGNDDSSWATDSTHLVSVGDAALRQELYSPKGSSLIGGIEITAESFGVIGGNVSQEIALNNARLIKGKAEELSNIGGATIIFSRSLYLVHMAPEEFDSTNENLNVSALRIPFDNIILRGQGWGGTTIRAFSSDASYGVIQWSKPPLENGITKVRNVGLHDICIDGNYNGDFTVGNYVRETEGILGAGIEGLNIVRTKVKNCSHYGMGLQNGGFKACHINGFWSENTGADGIDIKDNGSISRAFQLDNIVVLNFGQLDQPANPWAGVDIMSLAPKASNIYVSDFGNKGQPGAGVRIKQGILGSTTNRGTGGAWADITNITVVQNRFKSTDSEVIGFHIKAPFVNYSNIACFGYEGGRIGTSIYVEERYAQGSNLQCANAIAGYQATTASGASDRQYGDAEGCTISGIVCRDVNTALRLNRKYQKLTNVTLKDCLVGFESGGSNSGRVIVKGLHLEGVTNPFNNLGGTFHVIEDITGPDSDNLQNSLAVIRDSTGFARTALVSKNGIGLYVGATESAAGTEVFRASASTLLSNVPLSMNSNIQPSSPNTRTVGTSSSPFSGGFTQTAFTVTSDETEKTRTELLSDEILDAWSEVDFCQFQYIDRVIIKGDDGARWHVGIVAQRVKEAFERHGLDPFKYALLCYDEWGHEDAITSVVPAGYDESGVVLEEEKLVIDKAETLPGQRYGIRYEQALVMEASLQRRAVKRLEDKLNLYISMISK